MVKTILVFLCSKNISLTAFIDDFTNKAKCVCKVIFEIHVTILVFQYSGWSLDWVKTYMDPTRIPIHLRILWDTLEGTVALLEGKPPKWRNRS